MSQDTYLNTHADDIQFDMKMIEAEINNECGHSMDWEEAKRGIGVHGYSTYT